MIKISDYTKENLEQLLHESKSYSNFLDKIGYSKSGNGYKFTKKYLDDIGVSYVFLSSKRWSSVEIAKENVFVENKSFTNKDLKKKILKYKLLEYKCVGENCGNTGEWLGKPIALQLDNKNGVHNDNRIENLRFLCPNCHSQTDTYAGKNLKNKNTDC